MSRTSGSRCPCKPNLETGIEAGEVPSDPWRSGRGLCQGSRLVAREVFAFVIFDQNQTRVESCMSQTFFLLPLLKFTEPVKSNLPKKKVVFQPPFFEGVIFHVLPQTG